MRSLLKWGVALMLCIVIAAANERPNNEVSRWIVKVVYSTHDFSYLRGKLIREQPTKLAVFDDGTLRLRNFSKLKQEEKGFLLYYEDHLTITANENGVIIFTGYTKTAGKRLIVAYDDGMTATYEFIDTLSKLPYTTVAQGEKLATVTQGVLQLSVEQNGSPLDEQALRQWLLYAP